MKKQNDSEAFIPIEWQMQYFTFSPVILKYKFAIIPRAMNNEVGVEGFKADDLKLIINEILLKVEELFKKDLNTDKKILSLKKRSG